MSDRTDERVRTHWDGCELVHIDCARARIEALAAETQTLRENVQASEQAVLDAHRCFGEIIDAIGAERHSAVADRDRLADTLDVVLGYVNRQRAALTAAQPPAPAVPDLSKAIAVAMIYHDMPGATEFMASLKAAAQQPLYRGRDGGSDDR